MTDKQLEEKKEQFVLDTNSLLERELTENDLDIIFHWISRLVEEVERETKEIDRKLMEKVADSDYQFGFIRGTQTSESLTPLRISEHEEERKKIRKEMMERFYN